MGAGVAVGVGDGLGEAVGVGVGDGVAVGVALAACEVVGAGELEDAGPGAPSPSTNPLATATPPMPSATPAAPIARSGPVGARRARPAMPRHAGSGARTILVVTRPSIMSGAGGPQAAVAGRVREVAIASLVIDRQADARLLLSVERVGGLLGVAAVAASTPSIADRRSPCSPSSGQTRSTSRRIPTAPPVKPTGLTYEISRRRPIFPGGCPPSIFGAGELNFRVRDGNGWFLSASVTGIDLQMSTFAPSGRVEGWKQRFIVDTGGGAALSERDPAAC